MQRIAQFDEEIEVTGNFETDSLNVLTSAGYAIVAETQASEPAVQTYATGVVEVTNITFQDEASTAQNDFIVISNADGDEWAVAIDKVVAQEVQELTFQAISSTNSGDFVILESVDGNAYGVSIDKSLAAEVSTVTTAATASVTSGDYVAIYAEDDTAYAISLDKSEAAQVDQVTLQDAVTLSNDDFLVVTTVDSEVYAIAYDKTLAPETTLVTLPSPGGLNDNDYFTFYAKGSSGELSYAVNLDQSLKPQIEEVLFDDAATTVNDDWLRVYAQDSTVYGLALDKSASAQNFTINFPTQALCNDGDFAVLTSINSLAWGFALDKTGQFGHSTFTFQAKASCVSGDYLYLTGQDGSHWAAAVDITGSDAAPTGSAWAGVSSGNKVQVNLSAATTADEVSLAFLSALNGLTGFSAVFDLTDGGTGILDCLQVVIGTTSANVTWDSSDTGSATSMTVTTLNAGMAETVPSASQWAAVDVSRKVIVHIASDVSGADVATSVDTALASITDLINYWTYTPSSNTINFVNASTGPCADPVDWNEDASGDATFYYTFTSHGTSAGAPSAASWAAIPSGQKSVVDIGSLTDAASVAAAVLTAANGISGLSSKITVTNPSFDGTLLFTQITSGACTDMDSFDSAGTGAGVATVTVTQQGAATTTPTGAVWNGSLTAKGTANIFGLSTDVEVASAVATVAAAISGTDTIVTDNADGTITIASAIKGVVAGVPQSLNSDDTGAGGATVTVTIQGAASSAPTGATWVAIPSDHKTVVLTDKTQSAADLAAVSVTALNSIGGFTARVTVDDSAADGTFTLTQTETGFCVAAQAYNSQEDAGSSIAVTTLTSGSEQVVPVGPIWEAIPDEQKMTIDIRAYTTAAQIANAIYTQAAAMMASKITMSYTGGNAYVTLTQLVKGACDAPVPLNIDDTGVGSFTVNVTTNGADQLEPTVTAWTQLSNKIIVDGTVISTATQVATAVYNGFDSFSGINTKLSIVNNSDGTLTVTNIALGNAPSPVVSTYNGSGSSSISFTITTPGGVATVPTAAAWLAVPALQRISAACIGLSTADAIVGAVKSALESLDGFSDTITLVDAGSGVLRATQVVDGLCPNPVPSNADGTGAGSITFVVATPGVASDLVVATSTIEIADHGYFTGLGVKLSGGTLPSPLVSGTVYYVIAVDASHIKLATSNLAALAGNNINFTNEGAFSTTYTVTPEAFSIKIRVQASNDDVIYADVPDSEVTLAEESNVYLWNYAVFYQYVRLAGTITGGQCLLNYNIHAKG